MTEKNILVICKTKLIKKISYLQSVFGPEQKINLFLQFSRKVPAGSEMNFLVHWPRQLVDGKIQWPANFSSIAFLCHIYICLSVLLR